MNVATFYRLVQISAQISILWSHHEIKLSDTYREGSQVSIQACTSMHLFLSPERHQALLAITNFPPPGIYLPCIIRRTTKDTKFYRHNFSIIFMIQKMSIFNVRMLCLKGCGQEFQDLVWKSIPFLTAMGESSVPLTKSGNKSNHTSVSMCPSLLRAKECRHTLRLPAFWWWQSQQMKRLLKPSVQPEIRFRRSSGICIQLEMNRKKESQVTVFLLLVCYNSNHFKCSSYPFLENSLQYFAWV